MKRFILVLVFAMCSTTLFAQKITISFNQDGIKCSGIVENGKYKLSATGTPTCVFDYKLERINDYTFKLYVYNPSRAGFIPATYFLYASGDCEVHAGNRIFYGVWGYIDEYSQNINTNHDITQSYNIQQLLG